MAIYYHMSGGFHNSSRAWMLTSLALRMAQSVSGCIYSYILHVSYIRSGWFAYVSHCDFSRVAHKGLQTVTVIDGTSSPLQRNEEGGYGGKRSHSSVSFAMGWASLERFPLRQSFLVAPVSKAHLSFQTVRCKNAPRRGR